MKKLLFFGVLLCMLIGTTSVQATDIAVDNVNVVFTDAYAVVKDGRTLAPLRAVAEAMGADVQWNAGDKSIVLTKEVYDAIYDGKTYDKAVFVSEMKLGSFAIRIKMLYNGDVVYDVKKEMDIRAQSINGRTYVPARYVGYALGYEIEWKNNTVCYRDVKMQNTEFTVDKSVKFPTIVSEKFPTRAYRGYGDVIVADGDYGTRKVIGTNKSNGRKIYYYVDGAWNYEIGGLVVIDTDKFDVDLSDPAATVENFESVYRDITNSTITKIEDSDTMRWLCLMRDAKSPSAKLGYRYIPIDVETDKYQPMWCIKPISMPVDYSHYVYKDDAGQNVEGFKSKFLTDDRYCAADMLLMLHTLMEETGERIWQMMYDYYNCCGYQEKTQTEYVSADFVSPPIDESITSLYGLSFKSHSISGVGEYVLDLNDEVNGNNIRIAYDGVKVKTENSYSSRLSGYNFAVYF